MATATKKSIPERKRLAAIFASFAVLIMGAASLLRTMSLDYYTVLCTLQKILPACLALGGLGWFMGMILDKPKRRGRSGANSLLINELLKTSAPEIQSVSDHPPEENVEG